jgi:leucyl aminopeptidase
LTTDTLKEVLTELTSFRNRYYKSSYGAQSCRWLIKQIREVADGFDHVSVKEFEHSVSVTYTFTHT